ncbi:MacS family sensor histidine kinase [Actinokineospora sp. HUAS TT18]|uniref:MacS family sensor histidine kinase n=1 Tax=Actinokineospora sp. HUAS TT18 TaxID=3447451 RepID=UPI003F51B543
MTGRVRLPGERYRGPDRPEPKDPAAPLWLSAVLLRIITFFFAAGVVFNHRDEYANATAGWVTVGVMAVWTAVTSVYYLRENNRAVWFMLLDLAICCGAMSMSRIVLTHEQLTELAVPLVPTVWVTAVVAVGAVRAGLTGGTAFGLVVALFNYGVRGYIDTDLTRDLVLLVGIGAVLGLAATTSRQSAERLAKALRVEAATAERERLARTIHDSVLQVLARVGKRGRELGGEAAELAELAGRQEVALRALVAAAPLESTEDGSADLRPRLQVLATDRYQVSVPATPVMVTEAAAGELAYLVQEALHNVDRHAGRGAKAWVLLEDLGDEVVLSIRDDGVGIPSGRIAAAEVEGRMGIARSIRGRVSDLGGTITLETAPNMGTEWEIRVPTAKGAR